METLYFFIYILLYFTHGITKIIFGKQTGKKYRVALNLLFIFYYTFTNKGTQWCNKNISWQHCDLARRNNDVSQAIM